MADDTPESRPAPSTPTSGLSVDAYGVRVVQRDDDLAAELAAQLDRLRTRISVAEQSLRHDFDLRRQAVAVIGAAVLLLVSLVIVLQPYLQRSPYGPPASSRTILDDVFAYILLVAGYWLHRSWRTLNLLAARRRALRHAVAHAESAMNHAYGALRDHELRPRPMAREVASP